MRLWRSVPIHARPTMPPPLPPGRRLHDVPGNRLSRRSGGFGDTISKLKLETLPATGASVHMEYRGKHYTIVQGIRRGSWKWTVELHERGVKSGESPTREAAKVRVVWMIDKALAYNKRNRVTPADNGPL